jgi:4-amino-4-deoxy-L-arabinose transferase-like glycosyltransferase
MNRWLQRGLLIVILLAAAALRLAGIDWDDYHHFHPDERYITWVATTIEWPNSWRTAFNPSQSTFNPFYWPPAAASEGIEVLQDQPRRYAYGHLPLYVGVAATRLMERAGPALAASLPSAWLLTRDLLNEGGLVEFRHLTAVTRALTALLDVGTVALVFLLGRQVYGAAVGLLAAAFLAVNVMHIQLAHFFAVDPYMTFFVVAALYFMVASLRVGESSSGRVAGDRSLFTVHGSLFTVYWLLAAVCVGLAVGSKFSAVLLFLPLALAAWLSPIAGRSWRLVAAVLVAGLAFFLTNPFALLDFTCEVVTPSYQLGPVTIPALDWRSCYLDNVTRQNAMVRGGDNFPFTRQYEGTLPYLYYVEMQLRWGMGPLLGLVAFAGFGWAILKEIRDWRLEIANRRWNIGQSPISNLQSLVSSSQIILLAWAVPFFLTTGSFYVKFMRYLQPLVPFLMIYGAALLFRWRWVWGRWLVIAAVFVATTLYALSFVNLYSQPHPWVAASEWIFDNVEPGTMILSEQWDDTLPASLAVNGELRRRAEYVDQSLTWLSGMGERDDEAKLAENLDLLAEAEYLTLASNRVYGVVPRLPDQYSISSQYHQLLFDGSLGYEPVFVATRTPHLAGFHLIPDTFGWPGLRPPALVADFLDSLSGVSGGRADESFTVYDQPLTIIFQNVEHKTAGEMMHLFSLE